MKLSDAEKRMVAGLRRRKESWVRTRVHFLFSSVWSFITGVFFIYLVCQELSDLSPDSKHFNHEIWGPILGAPLGIFFLLYGVWLYVYTRVNWHGRPEIDLLLKLFEELNGSDNKSNEK